MSDEVRAVIGTGKTLKIGDDTWMITDPGTRIEYVDFVTEARSYNGNFYLSFAQSIIDIGNPPEAVICSRLRMNLVTAQAMHGWLGDMIKNAMQPVDKSKAN